MQADTSTNQKSNHSGDWLDGLLVKESSGQFKRWQSKQSAAKTGANISENAWKLSPADDSFRQSSPTISDDRKSEHIFHDDDQKQLQSLARLQSTDDNPRYSIDKIVARIIEKHDLKLDSENKVKFSELLFDFFRGRKKAPLIRQILGEKVLVQGRVISPATIDSIMSVIKGLRVKIEEVGGTVVRAMDMIDKKQGTRPPMDFLVEPRPSFVGTSFVENSKGGKTHEEIAKALRNIADQAEKEGSKSPEKVIKIPPAVDKVKTETPISPQLPKPAKELPAVEQHNVLPRVNRAVVQPMKSSVTDVVSKSQASAAPSKKFSLTGPVEELKNMTIGNFRYLGQTLEERMEKLLDKFSVLEQDSYTKRAQGIAAWRQSPVYKAYLDLGRDSMIKNKKIEDLISELKAAGTTTLDISEFNAITDLNKQLRF